MCYWRSFTLIYCGSLVIVFSYRVSSYLSLTAAEGEIKLPFQLYIF